MSYNSDDHSGEAKKKREYLEKVERILDRHKAGKLPRAYYSIDKEGKPYISPHKLMLKKNAHLLR